ncbi:hypothetical protein GCM10010512_51160 [Streptomyces thermoviolaceus subsp. thermoviolaceus]|nr:hypothetical protein GCM10010499_33280 [Streptomyces thermoviolaceus subsp. apingens]GHB13555.1 hypothetical protein GCM10010512_51160 [Streptomyces thermoviolaceus subsp. thermoviolaceus]
MVLPTAVARGRNPLSSPCDPEYAPAGDVGAALLLIDSRLTAVRDGRTQADPVQQKLVGQFAASLGPEGVDGVLDGVCTLIFMFMQWLRMAYEDHDEDVIAGVVPSLVATMRRMPKSVRPEVIPTMAGLVVAAGTGLSPSLWRRQYGDWSDEELTALEATAFLLAEHINRITDDHAFATRMIADALSRSEEGLG